MSSSGLVLFYTRCKNEHEKPEHRLVFTMVSVSEMKNGKNSGIAWWGKDDYTFEKVKGIKPVLGNDALKILKILEIEPFADSTTGTLIAIMGASKSIAGFSDELDFERGSFTDELNSVIEDSLYKWYWPRMQSEDRKLKIYLNDKKINPTLKGYGVYAELLEACIKSNEDQTRTSGEEREVYYNNEIVPASQRPEHTLSIFKIALQRPGGLIGTLAVKELPSGFPSKNFHFLNKIAMVRKPGMVVYYEGNGITLRADTQIAALFLVNSDLAVKSNASSDFYIMDDAFRKSEDPSHNTWNCHTLNAVKEVWFKSWVNAAKKQTATKLNGLLNKPEVVKQQQTSISTASKKLGSILLGEGKAKSIKMGPNYGDSSGAGGSGTRKIRPRVKIISVDYRSEGTIKVGLQLVNISPGRHIVSLQALTDSNAGYDSEKWADEGLGHFPFGFSASAITGGIADGRVVQSLNNIGFEEFRIDAETSTATLLHIDNYSAGIAIINCDAQITIQTRDVMFDIVMK